ncbi:glycosyltransferase [Fimbriimonadia bacterium ATM]|nr:MAG: glycosyltransferase [Armatimonadota bacterium]MBC6970134.1 glycosyltransferase [Armatimonadota bacterium]MCE7900537.1 glycosyltransferase [Armatimonadetes bacterium ATM1]MDL1929607.1 glycosyltransferase [Fimbriimonadia bacterium ATM]RIJ97085.1 MAG: hypothetical protein DCC45_03330 [Armatimonadota bacterium]
MAYDPGKKLLIIKLSSLGDIVHSMPVAMALKRHRPDLEIHWLVRDQFADLLAAHPAVDKVIQVRRKPGLSEIFRLRRQLRSEQYDTSVDLQSLARSAVATWFSRAKLRLGYHRQQEGAWLFSKAVAPKVPGEHVIRQYGALAEALGCPIDPIEFGLSPQPEAVQRICEKLEQIGVNGPFVALNLGSGGAEKRWPVEHYARLVPMLRSAGLTPVVIGSPGEVSLYEELCKFVGEKVPSLVGQTSIAELVAVLSRCAAHVGADTGSSHIAVALGRPVVSVMGPTLPERSGPFERREFTLYKGPDGLTSISPEEVLAVLMRALRPTERADSAQAKEAVYWPYFPVRRPPTFIWRFCFGIVGYSLYCIYATLAIPYLVLQAVKRHWSGRYATLGLRRTLGGTRPPRRGNWVVLVGTGLGETRTAINAAASLQKTRNPDIAVALEYGEVARSLKGSYSFPLLVAPFNNPISVAINLIKFRPRALIFIEHARNLHWTFWSRVFGAKTLLVNVNISERKAQRYSKYPFSSVLFNSVDLVIAQSDEHRDRLIRSGVQEHRIRVAGPAMVNEVPEEHRPAIIEKWKNLLGIDGARPVVVAGSTHAEDERVLIEAFAKFRKTFPDAVLCIAPRKLHRVPGVDKVLRDTKTEFVRRSELPAKLPPSGVVQIDTQGELSELYCLATVAFVGGSFVPNHGGHTPLEAISWGVPVTIGTNFLHQEAVVYASRDAGVLTICRNAEELADEWLRIAGDPSTRAELEAKCRELLARHQKVYEAWYDALWE